MRKSLSTSSLSVSKRFFVVELIIIFTFASIPLFVDLPYRINVFLAWEGAYRLYLGQIPFKDFGLPLGYGFWLIPALFFKIFGPYLFTLVKAQAFINILSGITFSSILKIAGVKPPHKFIAVLLFVISYSFVNFWPWYNHTVFFYQLVSINFLLLILLKNEKGGRFYIYTFLSTLFLFLSIFTKQDGGILALFINLFILLYYSIIKKNVKVPILYGLSFLLITALVITPLLKYDFLYWFNHGQPPHSSRLYLMDFLTEIFSGSRWIKFYVFLIGILMLLRYNDINVFLKDERKFTFFLLTIGILVEATLVQVTSYIPHNVNIYFHSFAIAYILANLDTSVKLKRPIGLLIVSFLLIVWWSSDFWVYGQRVIKRVAPELVKTNHEGVSKNTWMLTQDTAKVSRQEWVTIPNLPAFENILVPKSTAEGIKRLQKMEVFDHTAKVLNMTELTPLAFELGFEPEKGSNIPLWYHKEVALFDREIDMYCKRITNDYYDVVLFESIDYLNNFYPREVLHCLEKHYTLIDQFLAPREIQTSYIKVYIRKTVPVEN